MDEIAYSVKEVFRLARNGDLENLRSLVDEYNVELNIRDEWDSTPLYYACLCGHEDIVQLLLKHGARCEANTFDAERCFYAALTQRIKKMLREYKAVTSEYFRRDLYQEFLRGCGESCSFADMLFRVGSESLGAHKVILSARCPYFASLLKSKWRDRNAVALKKNSVSASAFRYFINYLYIGRIDMPLGDVQDLVAICKKCEMHDLLNSVNKAVRSFHYYADTKPESMRNRVSLISVGDGRDIEDIQESFTRLAELCIPNPFRFKQFFDEVPEIFSISLDDDYADVDMPQLSSDGKPCFADVCFIIQGYEFFCHKVFLCRRSEYFKALIHFTDLENDASKDFFEIYLNEISPEVFAAVINYIYADNCKIFPDTIYELLYFSDLFLLPGLKNKCAAFLSQELTPENVILILKLARLYTLNRLETQCAGFIAINLPDVLVLEEFIDLIKEDASVIKKREETDTIQIIDDIRHHLLKLALPGMNPTTYDLDVNSRFELLDGVLKTLGLDA